MQGLLPESHLGAVADEYSLGRAGGSVATVRSQGSAGEGQRPPRARRATSADAPEQLRRHRRATPVKRESAARAARFGTEDDPCMKFCREQRLTASGPAFSGYGSA